MSDKVSNHAIYLSKISNAEIVILNVTLSIFTPEINSITATSKEEHGSQKSNRNLEIK